MKKHIQMIMLFVVVIISFFLRTYKITAIPPSLSWDEVSIGYNAYSILKTGRDEHQRFLPLDTFVAYGDYKPPLAIYATVPFVAVFGLGDLAVRLPSAVSGTLTVLMTYFLVIELISVFAADASKEIRSELIGWLPILSSSLLAFSPWHINLSRAGFEANIALFLIVLGIYLALRALKQPKFWYFAWVPFIGAIYTFNSSRYFAPMFGVVILLFFWKTIWSQKKQFIIGFVIACLLMVPIVPHLLSNASRLRFDEVNIFTDLSVVTTANARIAYEHNTALAKLLHNRRFGYALDFLRHYTDNLQPSFLFTKGDGNPKFSIQDVGQLYLIEAPLLFVGLLSLFAAYPQMGWFLLLWLLLAIVPAATARETPHALRILDSLPTWQIFIAYGIYTIVSGLGRANSRIKAKFSTWEVCGLLIILYVFSISYYLFYYYVHYPKTYSGEWQYGYREAINYAQTVKNNYNTIYISESIGRAYMYTLFYTKYDPNKFWQTKDSSFDSAGFYHVYRFDKYRFITSMPTTPLKSGMLFIADPGWVPKGAHVLKRINLLDGSPQLVIFDI